VTQTELQRALVTSEALQSRLSEARADADRLSTTADSAKERLHIECEKLRDRLEKANTDNERLRGDINKLERGSISTENERVARAETESARLQRELEKSQAHLAKYQENQEAARIEFERMNTEMQRMHSQLEKAQADLEQARRDVSNTGAQGQQLERLTVERDQLVKQLEKSQDMLMNFQQELQQAEAALAAKNKGQSTSEQEAQRLRQDLEKARRLADNAAQELTKLQAHKEAEAQQLSKETEVLRQEMLRMSKELQHAKETGNATKDIAAAAGRDAAEIARLNKDLEGAKGALHNANVERDRFQAQLEMLVQELEQKQVTSSAPEEKKRFVLCLFFGFPDLVLSFGANSFSSVVKFCVVADVIWLVFLVGLVRREPKAAVRRDAERRRGCGAEEAAGRAETAPGRAQKAVGRKGQAIGRKGESTG